MKLGTAIKSIRKIKGIKQNELAKSIGINNSYLSQIESNNRIPTVDLLDKIAIDLKVPLYVLFKTYTDINPFIKFENDYNSHFKLNIPYDERVKFINNYIKTN